MGPCLQLPRQLQADLCIKVAPSSGTFITFRQHERRISRNIAECMTSASPMSQAGRYQRPWPTVLTLCPIHADQLDRKRQNTTVHCSHYMFFSTSSRVMTHKRWNGEVQNVVSQPSQHCALNLLCHVFVFKPMSFLFIDRSQSLRE